MENRTNNRTESHASEKRTKESHACELKPCPFCGGEAMVFYNIGSSGNKVYSVQCSQCGVIPIYRLNTEEAAIAAWNRRYGDE